MTERSYRVTLALITGVVTLVTLCWAVLVPSYRAPDEPQHVNSVVRVLYGGGWPAPNEAEMLPVLVTAQSEGAVTADLPGSIADRFDRDFVDVDPLPDAARTEVDADNAQAEPPLGRPDQMTQHPPLYYLVTAATIDAAGLEAERWDIQLIAMRLLSVALAAPLPLLIAAAVRQLTASRAAALCAAALPLFVPQLTHIGGSVSNDVLLTLAGAVTTVLIVRVLQGDDRYRVAVVLGVALGVGLLAKAFMVFFLPAVVLAFVLTRARRTLWSRLGRAMVALGVGFAVGGWWWVRNLLVYGEIQPSAGIKVVSPDPERDSAVEYYTTALGDVAHSFWGKFAWLEIPLPGWFVALASVLTVVLVAVGVSVRRARRECVLLAGLAGLVLAAVLVRGYGAYVDDGLYAGLQGRYLYVAVVAVAIVAGVGLWRLLGRSERATLRALPVVVLAGVVVSAYGLWTAFLGFYWDNGAEDALQRWVAWSPATSTQVALLLGALALGVVLLVARTGVAAARAPRLPSTDRHAAGDGGAAL